MNDELDIDKRTLEAIDKLMRKYAEQVNKTDLSQTSKTMYTDFANCFVRWIHGEFKPGSVGPWKASKVSARTR